jgi:hypothetical protein
MMRVEVSADLYHWAQRRSRVDTAALEALPEAQGVGGRYVGADA